MVVFEVNKEVLVEFEVMGFFIVCFICVLYFIGFCFFWFFDSVDSIEYL